MTLASLTWLLFVCVTEENEFSEQPNDSLNVSSSSSGGSRPFIWIWQCLLLLLFFSHEYLNLFFFFWSLEQRRTDISTVLCLERLLLAVFHILRRKWISSICLLFLTVFHSSLFFNLSFISLLKNSSFTLSWCISFWYNFKDTSLKRKVLDFHFCVISNCQSLFLISSWLLFWHFDS